MTHTAALASSVLAKIPSPDKAQYRLGPVPLRMYALCILAGILVAVWLGDKRWQARGGRPQEVVDIAIWAVPFGLLGGRLYHVITTPEPYFGKDGDWVKSFYIWQGGLGIWGAISLGALGAWIGCRRHHASLKTFADAVAPGIVLAQAIGRWGNWFNNELFGNPTTMPWGLQVHCMDQSTQTAMACSGSTSTLLPGLYQPTFLYESLWCVGVALVVIWADRRFTLGYGRAFAVYVAAYTVGRGWIEYLRVDNAHIIGGLRLNDWTAMIVFVGAVVYFVRSARKFPGREASPYQDAPSAAGPVNLDGADESVGDGEPKPERVESDSPEPAAPSSAAEPGETTPDEALPDSADSDRSESGEGKPVSSGTTARNETTE